MCELVNARHFSFYSFCLRPVVSLSGSWSQRVLTLVVGGGGQGGPGGGSQGRSGPKRISTAQLRLDEGVWNRRRRRRGLYTVTSGRQSMPGRKGKGDGPEIRARVWASARVPLVLYALRPPAQDITTQVEATTRESRGKRKTTGRIEWKKRRKWKGSKFCGPIEIGIRMCKRRVERAAVL